MLCCSSLEISGVEVSQASIGEIMSARSNGRSGLIDGDSLSFGRGRPTLVEPFLAVRLCACRWRMSSTAWDIAGTNSSARQWSRTAWRGGELVISSSVAGDFEEAGFEEAALGFVSGE